MVDRWWGGNYLLNWKINDGFTWTNVEVSDKKSAIMVPNMVVLTIIMLI